jgi:hypothetical protein
MSMSILVADDEPDVAELFPFPARDPSGHLGPPRR